MATLVSTQRIRRYNLIAGFAHLMQMGVVLALANDFSLPIVARYMAGPPGSSFAEPVTLLKTPVGITVAIFLGLSAFFHFLVASPQFFARYQTGLVAGHNYFRWVEYSISSSVMIVLIAQICGVSDVVALIALFGVNASMILFGWLQEKYENQAAAVGSHLYSDALQESFLGSPSPFMYFQLVDLVIRRHQHSYTELSSRSLSSSILLQSCSFFNIGKLEIGQIICVAKRLT